MIDWKGFKQQAQSNPKRVIGFVIGLATCFFVMWAFILTKTNIQSTQKKSVFNTQSVETKSDETNTSKEPEIPLSSEITSTDAESDAISIIPKRREPVIEERSSESPFSAITPVLFLFALVLGGFWLVKSRKVKSSTGKFMDILGSQQLGVNQQVSLLYVNKEYWVVGHSNGQMNLLHRYNELEWEGESRLNQEEQPRLDSSFLSLLKRENKNYEAVSD